MPRLGAVVSTTNVTDQLAAEVTWDPASLANGASASQSVTVTGAAVGDPAVAGFTGINAAGWRLTACVIAANTVSVFLTNNTGGTLNLASGTLKVVVFKP